MPFRAAFFLSVFALVYMLPVHNNMVAAKQVSRSVKCELSPFTGSWVSSEPTVSFLSKLSITDRCKQVISEPVAINNPWAGDLGIQTKSTYREYTLRPSSTCSPFDCVWGRSLGRLAEKGKLKARFRMFLSQRYIELTRQGGKMLISWRIKYTGKKRPDQVGETLMVRVK
ncbi:MAG: hypothetical protein L3J67_00305 [Hyphomicrobiaceae bacterium]|nr:hypothetical protein [Hyphomicrobiaceae bacterium]